MFVQCANCSHDLKPRARHCGHCGTEITLVRESIEASLPVPVRPAPLVPLTPCPAHHELVVQAQLEMHTRLNPLMNRERLKAMVMAIAAHGGTGAVGYWSDD